MADLTVATTILEQLGGGRFKAMTGAKAFVGGEDFLSFRLPGAGGFTKHGINYVHITLMPSDTYDVSFSRVRGATVTPVTELTDIYAENLRDVFTLHTGLHTSF